MDNTCRVCGGQNCLIAVSGTAKDKCTNKCKCVFTLPVCEHREDHMQRMAADGY